MPMWGTELEQDDGAPFRAHALPQTLEARFMQRITPLLAPGKTPIPRPTTETQREHGYEWQVAADELYQVALNLRVAAQGARTKWAQDMLAQAYHSVAQRYRFALAKAARFTPTQPVERQS